MRKYAADNLMFLREVYPDLYRLVRGRQFDKSAISIELCKNGDKNLIVSEKKMRLYSQYDPKIEAARWYSQIQDDIVPEEHILIYGLGLGYHLETVMEHNPSAKLYIIEPDENVFLAFIECRDIRSILSSEQIVALAVGNNRVVYNELLQVISRNVQGKFKVVCTPVYERIYKSGVSMLRTEVERHVQSYRSDLATYRTFGVEWPRNIILNAPYAFKSHNISELKERYHNIPAIIVGSGPSLKADIELLHQIKDKYLIIAAGSSIQALLYHRIIPDLIVSIDGGEANFEVFRDIELSEIPLLFSSIIHSGILEKTDGNTIYVRFNIDSITDYLYYNCENYPVFQSTTSVTGTAIQAAHYLGCNPIIFTGQDLSYPEDLFYTEGVDHIEKTKLDSVIANATESVKNVKGGYNKTTKKMLNTLYDMENTITVCSNRIFINCSSLGAKIKNAEYKSLSAVVQELSDNFHKPDLKQLLSEMEPDRDVWSRGLINLVNLKEDLRQYEKLLANIKQELEKLVHNDYPTEQQFNIVSEQWDIITSHKVFTNILIISMRSNLLVFPRYFAQIREEKDARKKAQFIYTNIGMFVQQLIVLVPNVMEWVEMAIKRVNKLEITS